MTTSPPLAARDLARRVLGARAAGQLTIQVEPDDIRHYRYEWSDGGLVVTASDEIAATVALRDYLRRKLQRDVQWASKLPLDVELQPCEPHAVTARVAEQYMFNFCTYSYSTAHWGWAEWERELDWMALHGVTMPLALVGHEGVLFEAWRRLGLSDGEALEFLGDPIFLPFQFMGCIEGDEAVMTEGWIRERVELGRRILDRCRELGMKPILPGFTGHVPTGWADDATRPRDWQGNATRFLDPADDRFVQVASTIARVQRELLGEATHFAADPFIEIVPVDDGTDFPALVGRRILEGITGVVPDAVWVMQAWPFSYQRDYWTDERIAAFLDGVASDRLLVLDLWAEADPIWPVADGFRGKDWQWCGLLNFGGRSDAVADLPRAVAEFERALASAHPPSGLGLSMESFHHNAVFFELLSDLAWTPVDDLAAWIGEFAAQRYGIDDPRARAAWKDLLATVYDAGGTRIFPEDFHGILTKRADLVAAQDAVEFRERAASMVWFEPARLLAGWTILTDLAEERPELAGGPLGIDLIEVAQAAGVRLVDERAARVLEAADAMWRRAETDELLAAIDVLDGVVAARSETRLAAAEARAAAAVSHGVDPERLRRAQRRILTSWNAAAGTDLDDYSGRIWHGLVGGYYRPRLEAWARSVEASAEFDPLAVQRLEAELDELWTRFTAADLGDGEPPLGSQTSGQRALQAHFAAAFGLDLPRETAP